MIDIDVIVVRNFLIALAIGALIGVEREKNQRASGHAGFAGLRTFILLAQLGSISAWVSIHVDSPAVLVIALGAAAVMLLAGYLLENRSHPESLGLSTEFAAISVFLLGGVVMYGYAELAVALGILTSAVLAFKQPMHEVVQKIGTDDIYAVLKLLIATFIILPLLPDTPIDPWEALNPYTLWLLVILISAISLVGYVAVRLLGEERGTVLTGIAGGLVSSTAVSLSFARRSQATKAETAADALAAGILAAWAVMFVRVLVMVAILNRPLLLTLIIPFALMGVCSGVLSGTFYLRSRNRRRVQADPESLPLKNPFSLGSAMQFALLFALVLVIVKLTQLYAPEGGIYLVAAIAGLTDVDAITLSMARQGGTDFSFAIATVAVAVAALSNTVVKCGLVLVLGQASLRSRLAVSTAVLLLVGALGALSVI